MTEALNEVEWYLEILPNMKVDQRNTEKANKPDGSESKEGYFTV